MPSIVDLLVPALKEVASSLEGSPLAGALLDDVKNVEAIVARHETAKEAEIVAWVVSRLHPEAPAAAAAPEPAA